MSEPKIAWTYTGPGYYYGVPAQDLTQDEFDTLLPEHQAIVREAPEYTEADLKQPDTSKDSTPPGKTGKSAGGDA